MPHFNYNSNATERALMAAMNDDLIRLKDKVIQDACEKLADGLREVAAKYALRVTSQDKDFGRGVILGIAIIEPVTEAPNEAT